MKPKHLVASLSLALCCASPIRAQTLEWIRQLGTAERDESYGVSADGLGNVYVSGETMGILEGTNNGSFDAFLAKYDASGNLEWTRQLGTYEGDGSWAVSADGVGNVYITGYTGGDLGGTNAGAADAFLAKYDANGTLQWTQQLGSSGYEHGFGVSADAVGNVYVSGDTSGDLADTSAGRTDAFLAKYDAGGTLEWVRQLGTEGRDVGYGVSADGLGDVYISGVTEGSLGGAHAGGRDAFVAKYDANGTLEWTRQFGTSGDDRGHGVSADGLGNVYFTGTVDFFVDFDAFLSKYDASGTLQWTRQLGGSSVSADGLGSVYILGGASLAKYDASGTLQWTRRLGGVAWNDVSADGLGNAYISGPTGGWPASEWDAFVAKFWADQADLNADFDLDGDVDGDDFILWQSGFPTTCCTATKGDGDYDNDGDVDGDDFLGWQSEFGSSNGSASAVPEPSSIVLLIAAFVGAAFVRRQ